MKVALLQLCASTDISANIKQALQMAEEALAQKAKFVLLPEVFNFRGKANHKEVFLKAAEKIPGPSSQPFIPLAQKHKAHILLGSLIEKGTATHAYNTSVLIDADGKIAAKYRKIHLFDARIGDKIVRERDCFLEGKKPATVKVDEFRMGLSICYDLRFPDLYQRYSKKGVDILTVPSCFTRKTGEAHWEALLRARAIENLSYVLAPNQIGIDARGMQAHGHSMIISPWGEIIARGSEGVEEIVFGDISLDEVKKARRILPGIIGRSSY